MKFGQVEIDLNALAALVTAIGGLVMVLKGATQRRKGKKDADGNP